MKSMIAIQILILQFFSIAQAWELDAKIVKYLLIVHLKLMLVMTHIHQHLQILLRVMTRQPLRRYRTFINLVKLVSCRVQQIILVILLFRRIIHHRRFQRNSVRVAHSKSSVFIRRFSFGIVSRERKIFGETFR